MKIPIPSSPQDWLFLREKIETFHRPDVSRHHHVIIWVYTCLGPITGVLYVASAIKRWQKHDRWLIRVDGQGYIHSHSHIMIAFWAVLFTIVNLALGVSLLRDCNSHLHSRTVWLHLLSYSVLAGMASTKAWVLLYAMPPSKYRLAKAKPKSGINLTPSSMQRYIPATLFNIFVVTLYAVSVFGGIPFTVSTVEMVGRVTSAYDEFQLAYPSLIDPSSSEIAQFRSHDQALTSFQVAVKSLENIQTNISHIGLLFFMTTSVQLIAVLFSSYRIMAALYHQVAILREAARRRKHLVQIGLHDNEVKWNHPYDPHAMAKIAAAPKQRSAFVSTDLISQTFSLDFRLKHYLPTFKRGTGISATIWSTKPFQKAEGQVIDGGVDELQDYYRQLRRYAINTFWHTTVATVVMVSLLTLSAMIMTKTLHASTPFKFEVTTFQWINITWNGGPGLVMSSISCIVAFSPAPALPREPEERSAASIDLPP